MTGGAPPLSELELCQRKLARAKKRVAILETMIEDKTRELYLASQGLEGKVAYLEKLYRIIPSALIVASRDGSIQEVNDSAAALLGCSRDEISDSTLATYWHGATEALASLDQQQYWVQKEEVWVSSEGTEVPVLLSTTCFDVNQDGEKQFVCVASDLRSRKRMEVELRHAQKLESVGQLAAGVAHEINTPMQFIGDNVHFLRDAFEDVLAVLDAYSEASTSLGDEERAALAEKEEDADIEFLRERSPKAFSRALEGIERVTEIVSAMKAFSHPSKEKAPADLNKVIKTAITVASNEYKYVADVETELGELPAVVCNVGDLNQVVLNLIINAAHAIQDRKLPDGARGTIRVSSAAEGGVAVISVSDSGCGIPVEARERIFEPFFTTKDVGRGTGQGLSLAHTVVTDRHGGALTFETELGSGTTFTIRLPIEGRAEGSAAATS